jgi:hypothetical protein
MITAMGTTRKPITLIPSEKFYRLRAYWGIYSLKNTKTYSFKDNNIFEEITVSKFIDMNPIWKKWYRESNRVVDPH